MSIDLIISSCAYDNCDVILLVLNERFGLVMENGVEFLYNLLIKQLYDKNQ